MGQGDLRPRYSLPETTMRSHIRTALDALLAWRLRPTAQHGHARPHHCPVVLGFYPIIPSTAASWRKRRSKVILLDAASCSLMTTLRRLRELPRRRSRKPSGGKGQSTSRLVSSPARTGPTSTRSTISRALASAGAISNPTC